MYMNYKISKKRGFTLVELLAVLVLLVIIALIAIGTVKNVLSEANDAIDEDTKKQILNAAEKWAVENSDKFDDIEETNLSIGLDVVFVLDVSGSMDYDNNRVLNAEGQKIQRAEAMAIATNTAIKSLYSSNDDINIGITTYGTSGSTFLPFAKYTTNDYYIKYQENYRTACSRKMGIISTGNIKKNGLNYSNSYLMYCDGTKMATGLNLAKNMFQNASDKASRIPVLIILTDGNDDEPYNAVVAANNVRNTMNSYGNQVFIYTVGFAVTEAPVALLVLNPTKDAIEKGISSSDSKTKSLAQSLKKDGKDYSYADMTFTDAVDATALTQIFTQISSEVIKATQVTQMCITIEDLYNDGYLSSKDFKIANSNDISEYIVVLANDTTNQYLFSFATDKKMPSEDITEKQWCANYIKERDNNK